LNYELEGFIFAALSDNYCRLAQIAAGRNIHAEGPLVLFKNNARINVPESILQQSVIITELIEVAE
jgi:hypothetical protein